MDEPDERLAVVYDEAVRALDRQAAAVDELRSRSATVLGAAALVAGFLGPEALERNPRLNAWVVLAGAAFAAIAVAVGFVLFPRRWTFTSSPRSMIQEYIDREDGVTLDSFRWGMALDHEKRYDDNEPTRRWLAKALMLGNLALVIEVAAWLMALRGRR